MANGAGGSKGGDAGPAPVVDSANDPMAISETWRRFMDAHVAGVGIGTMDDSREWASTALTQLRRRRTRTEGGWTRWSPPGPRRQRKIVFPVKKDNSFVDLLAVAKDDEAARCAVLLALALEAAETEARVAWNKLRAELRWKEPFAAEKSAALESAHSLDSWETTTAWGAGGSEGEPRASRTSTTS